MGSPPEELVPSRTPPSYATYRPPARISLHRVLSHFHLSPTYIREARGYVWARYRVAVAQRYQQRSRARARKEYARWARVDLPDSPFVFYPLSEQPEDTSFPIGGNFEDQLYAAKYLAGLLPDGMKLIVKEHPNQRPWRGRYDGYYHDLASIPGVELVAMSVDTFDLIDHCAAVATISGQAGWEALTRNKPVIAFGTPWYARCPYVYPIESLNRTSDPGWNDHPVVPSRIADWYSDLIASTHEGYMNVISAPSSPLSIEENIEAVSTAINQYMALKSGKAPRPRVSQ